MKKIVSIIAVLSFLISCIAPASFSQAENTENTNVMTSLSDTQRNSIGVLNYLAYLTKEIESQKSNRLYLEEAYSSLYNNTYMNSIDAVTLGQIKSLLTALNNFKMLTVKRDRLEYIYEQNQAQAIRNAIPSPLAIMNIVQSGSWQKALTSIVYMAVDSVTSYYASKSANDLQYLQDGWELDDEESEILHNGHLESIDYMWEIIHDYELPGDLAINEDDINRFVDWKSNNNLISRIQFLESNREVYQAFGEYWLTLAESYYDNGDMDKCLEAVKSYETYSTRIFRKDYHYAKVLPMAITAASLAYDEARYLEEVPRYAARIIANCDQEDWILRYFAAETYVDLAGRTADNAYLSQAYEIALNNVNYLVRKQISLNQEYSAAYKPVAIPDGTGKQKRSEIEAYNKGQEETRKTAVPPVSEALILNNDLLFTLAEQIGINDSEKAKITGILYGHGSKLFINPYLDARYSFGAATVPASSDIDISFDGKEIKIPVTFLSDNASVSVGGLDSSGKVFSIDGWTVKAVDRKNDAEPASFIATLASPDASSFSYSEGTTIWINLNSYGDEHTPDLQFLFSVSSKTDFLVPYLIFQRLEQ